MKFYEFHVYFIEKQQLMEANKLLGINHTYGMIGYNWQIWDLLTSQSSRIATFSAISSRLRLPKIAKKAVSTAILWVQNMQILVYFRLFLGLNQA